MVVVTGSLATVGGTVDGPAGDDGIGVVIVGRVRPAFSPPQPTMLSIATRTIKTEEYFIGTVPLALRIDGADRVGSALRLQSGSHEFLVHSDATCRATR